MPAEILLGGIVAAAFTWVVGAALAHLWTAQEALTKKIADNTIRITRLETLVAESAKNKGGPG